MKKTHPDTVVRQALDGVEAGAEEILADAVTVAIKASLSGQQTAYLNPPEIV
jgi:hypothetical protein